MNDSLERSRRQRAAMYAYGIAALSVRTVDELIDATLPHIVDAVEADAAGLLGTDPDGGTLITIRQIGFESAGAIAIAATSAALPAEAVRTQQGLSRELTEADFAAAPHLRATGMRFGASAPVRRPERPCVLSAYSRTRPFTRDDISTLEGTATILATAAARLELEQRLVDRETTIRAMLTQAPAIIWTTDTNLIFTNILGMAAPDMAYRTMYVGRSAEDAGTSQAGLAAMRAALDGATQKYSFSTPDQHFDVRVEPLRGDDGSIRGILAVAFDVTDRVRAAVDARASREELRRMAASMNVRQEEQRRLIARDIHDEMGQRLTALRLELGLLSREVRSAAARERVDSMSVLIREAADTVRRISADLRPPILDDFGLRAAFETELDTFSRRTGIGWELDCPEEIPVDRHASTALFRVLQESLTNVARHARARRVTLRVKIEPDAIVMEVSDDGRGITEAEGTDPASLGIVGIRERAYALGGDAVIEGLPDHGTVVRVRIPCDTTSRT